MGGRDLSAAASDAQDCVLGQERREMLRDPDGPTPGPPPPCGMAKVLCRLRWHTSAPMPPGEVSPTCAFMLAPSM